MAIYIAHAAADAGVAKSLARFLKGQSLPVRVADARRMSQFAKQADSVIVLWSRNMAGHFCKTQKKLEGVREQTETILVDIDGSRPPKGGAYDQIVDARSPGLRQARSWRTISALAARGDLREARKIETAAVASAAHREQPTADAQQRKNSKKKTFVAPYLFMATMMLGLVAAAIWLGAPQMMGFG